MTFDRRRLSLLLAGLIPAGALPPALGRPLGERAAKGAAPTPGVTLTAVDGVLVGHRTRSDATTGCSVVVVPAGAVGGVAVLGSAPGSRETQLLAPDNSVAEVHAIALSGGSAFGLATGDGVVRRLREEGIGLAFGGDHIPIVPGAIIFDLPLSGGVAPDADDGYAAAAAASDEPVAQGNVGAGTGATVGKIVGSPMKGGLGSAGYRFDDGTVVAALMVVNSRGDVRDPDTGRLLAGGLAEDGRTLLDTQAALLAGTSSGDTPGQNTAIGVVATNRTLDKAQANRLAKVAHGGLARAVVPTHTYWDGDTLFALATGTGPPLETATDFDRVDVAAAAAVAAAIVNAISAAEGMPGLPAARDIGTV